GVSMTFCTMALLEGETLAQRLRHRGTMTTSEALPIVKQMAAALGAAHAARIVHGDFKPGNVMLVPSAHGNERVVVTDFGLARRGAIDSAEASTTTGQPGWGTPAYMAPEQREGHSATYASDIFALGVVMQEMVIGRSSFPLQPQEVLDPRWPSAIRRCLDRDRSARFGTTHELVQALEGSTRMTWALAPVVLAVLVVSAIVLA